MIEITDEELAILRPKLSLVSPFVQSLVARIDRLERERENQEERLRGWKKELDKVTREKDAYVAENINLRSDLDRVERERTTAQEAAANLHADIDQLNRHEQGEGRGYRAADRGVAGHPPQVRH